MYHLNEIPSDNSSDSESSLSSHDDFSGNGEESDNNEFSVSYEDYEWIDGEDTDPEASYNHGINENYDYNGDTSSNEDNFPNVGIIYELDILSDEDDNHSEYTIGSDSSSIDLISNDSNVSEYSIQSDSHSIDEASIAVIVNLENSTSSYYSSSSEEDVVLFNDESEIENNDNDTNDANDVDDNEYDANEADVSESPIVNVVYDIGSVSNDVATSDDRPYISHANSGSSNASLQGFTENSSEYSSGPDYQSESGMDAGNTRLLCEVYGLLQETYNYVLCPMGCIGWSLIDFFHDIEPSSSLEEAMAEFMRREAIYLGDINVIFDMLKRVEIDISQTLDCAVCLVEFGTEEIGVKLPCAHVYHAKCIKKWIHVKPTCPMCRQKVNIDVAHNFGREEFLKNLRKMIQDILPLLRCH